MSLLQGNVLLTGASGGIGHAIARAFAAHGAALILTSRRTNVLEPLATEVGGRVIAADLSRREDVQRLASEVGEPDVAVFNAAVPASGLVLEYTDEQLDRALDINLRAPIVLARALAPAMISRGSGHLVFISSTSSKAASPGSSLYSATKFGLRGFALGLREDLHGTGVGVSLVAPGFVSDAGMFADSGASLPPGVGTRTPGQVGAAVIRAVRRNRAEIDVAPIAVRIGAAMSGLAPQTAASVSRRMGSERVAANISQGQLDKR